MGKIDFERHFKYAMNFILGGKQAKKKQLFHGVIASFVTIVKGFVSL